MSKSSLVKKVVTGITVVGMSLSLAACADNGEENTENTNAVSESSDSGKDSEEDVNESDSSDENSTDEVAVGEAAAAYYTEAFTRPLAGGSEILIEAQNEMIEAAGTEEIFSNSDPHEVIDNLPKDKQEALVAASEKYADSSDYVNYEDLSTADKVLMNIVTMMFKTMIADTVGDTIEISADPQFINVEGDKATLPPEALLFIVKSGLDENSTVSTESGLVTMDTPLVKTDDGWKIDGVKYVELMMAPVSPEEAAEVQSQMEQEQENSTTNE